MKRRSIKFNTNEKFEAAFWLLLASSYFLLPDHLFLLSQIMILGLFAVSLDILLGYAGILNVGHAAYFGTGAYSAGLLAKYGWGEPITGVVVATLICLALGYVLSYIITRGAHLTQLLITICICLLLSELVNRLPHITGGSDGLHVNNIWPIFGLYEFDLVGRTAFAYSFIMVLIGFLVIRSILHSPLGLTLVGIRENRKRMLALGVPVDARLRISFAASSAAAGYAGALLSQTTQFVGIDSIGFDRSAEILVILVVGGTGRLYGGMVGAIAYLLMHDWFAEMNPQYWMFWLGLFLIAIVLSGRGGVLGLLERVVPNLRRDRSCY